MLNILHEKINEIIPIVGVTQSSDGSYQIHYDNETPNADQQQQIDQIIQNFPIEILKIQKIEELDNNWQEILKNGWTTPYGWKLGIDNQDVTLLTGAFILAKEANNMGLSNTGTVIDMDGKSHELSLQDLTILMIQYGQFRSQLSSQDALKRELINNASTIEELNNISI
jgi:hypothetical protein